MDAQDMLSRHPVQNQKVVKLGLPIEKNVAHSNVLIRSLMEPRQVDFADSVEQLCDREVFLRDGTLIRLFLEDLRAGRIRMEATLKATDERKSIEPSVAPWIAKRLLRAMGYQIDARGELGYCDVVLVLVGALRRAGPERERKSGGRPSKPVWRSVMPQIYDWLVENGDPKEGDGGQAELERLAAGWAETQGENPSESTVREHVRAVIRARREELAKLDQVNNPAQGRKVHYRPYRPTAINPFRIVVSSNVTSTMRNDYGCLNGSPERTDRKLACGGGPARRRARHF